MFGFGNNNSNNNGITFGNSINNNSNNINMAFGNNNNNNVIAFGNNNNNSNNNGITFGNSNNNSNNNGITFGNNNNNNSNNGITFGNNNNNSNNNGITFGNNNNNNNNGITFGRSEQIQINGIIEKINKIKALILNSTLGKELENGLNEQKADIESLRKTNKFDPLIFAIFNDISKDKIQCIIDTVPYTTINYLFNYENKVLQTPLIVALLKNNFSLANWFIKKYQLNLNDINKTVIFNLIEQKHLTPKILKYILNKGFNVTNINSEFITHIIKYPIITLENSKLENNLEIIFDYYIYDTKFILNMLKKYYKEKTSLSKHELNEILKEEKSKIEIKEEYYKLAWESNNYIAWKTLYKYDTSSSEILYHYIIQYNRLEKAIKENDESFVKQILNLNCFPFKSLISKKLLQEADHLPTTLIFKLLVNAAVRTIPKEIARNSKGKKTLLPKNSFSIYNKPTITAASTSGFSSTSTPAITDSGSVTTTTTSTSGINFNNNPTFKFATTNTTPTPATGFSFNNKSIITTTSPTSTFSFNNKSTVTTTPPTSTFSFSNKPSVTTTPPAPTFSFSNKSVVTTTSASTFSFHSKSIDNATPSLSSFIFGNKSIDNSTPSASDLNSTTTNTTSDLNSTTTNTLNVIEKISEKKDQKEFSKINSNKSNDIIIDSNIPQNLYNFPKNLCIDQQYYPYLNLILNRIIDIGNLEMVKYMVENLPFKDILYRKDLNGEYPLFQAVQSLKHPVFEYLIKQRNIDDVVNSKNDNGNTLLDLAIQKKQVAIVKCLMNHGVRLNEPDVNGNPPLMKAILQNNFEIVLLIVTHHSFENDGVDFSSCQDVNGNTPITLAYRRGLQKIFQLLIHYLDINIGDSNGNTVLHYALLKEDIPTIKLLIEQGAEITLKNKDGESVLDMALFKKNKDLMYFLLEIYPMNSLNKLNEKGETFLISLIKSKFYSESEKQQFLNLLIDKGTNVNELDDNQNYSPLTYAIQNKYKLLVNLLINNGAKVNHIVKTPSPRNLLMISLEQEDLDIVKCLVECNADISYRNDQQNSPWSVALSHNNIPIIEYLAKYYVKKINEFDLMKILINNNNNNSGMSYGSNNINNNNKSLEKLKILIENGLDPDIKVNGDPLLHYCIKSLKGTLIEYLVDYGADLNALDSKNNTVLTLCNNYLRNNSNLRQTYNKIISKISN